MAEQESTQSLEEEIRILEEKLVARKMVEAEQRSPTSVREEKDIFHDVLREHVEAIKESAGEKPVRSEPADIIGSSASASSLANALAARRKAEELREKAHNEQVEALVGVALTKGILAAVDVARHLDNPHLLDDFHDMLVDEYYDKLVQARKIS